MAKKKVAMYYCNHCQHCRSQFSSTVFTHLRSEHRINPPVHNVDWWYQEEEVEDYQDVEDEDKE